MVGPSSYTNPVQITTNQAKSMQIALENRRLRLLPARLRANPLIMRTLRRPDGLRFAWWVVGFISLLSFIGTFGYKDSFPLLTVGLLEALLLIVNPIFGAWTAANVICLAVKTEEYELVMITALSDMKLVEGHTFAVFYRLRLPIILTLALLPSLGVRLTQYISSSYYYCARYSSECLRATVLRPALYYSVTIFAAIGIFVFGIVLATALALWWRNRDAAGTGAIVTVIFLIVVFFSLPNTRTTDSNLITTLVPTIPYTVLLYVMAGGIMFAAQVIARRRR